MDFDGASWATLPPNNDSFVENEPYWHVTSETAPYAFASDVHVPMLYPSNVDSSPPSSSWILVVVIYY